MLSVVQFIIRCQNIGQITTIGQGNEYVPRKRRVARIRSQETIHEYLRSGKLPRFPRSEMHHSGKRRRKTGTDTAAGRKPRADKA